jgi:3-hydroxyacyl-[acyl-carrier-protein] dehydratase
MLNQAEIEKLIPHRPPMLLIDEVLSQTETSLVARKTFRPDEFFFQGHYPDFPLVPGVVLCEVCMQAGAVLLAKFAAEGKGVPVATRLNEVKLKKMVRPNDVVEIEVQLNERVANAFFLSAKMTCDGKVCVRFDFGCTLSEAGSSP